MNVEDLKVGQTFKNYKELCLELDWEVKTANSKNAQFKELSRYCKYNKIGHKIVIEEIYESPQEKIDNRGSNSIYGNIIQILITDLLAQCKGHVSISRSKLMLSIGIVNTNYSACRELVPKLSKFIEMDEKFIYDFYNTSIGSFRSLIETALNNLMDKRIIMYSKAIKISEQGNYSTRIATEEELKLILSIEKGVLDELGYKQVSSVRVSKDWKKFRLKTKRLLQEESNIEYYFTAYEITVNQKYIIEERNELVDLLLEKVKRIESKNELNYIVYTNLLTNAENRHDKGFTSSKRMAKTRLDGMYIENMKQLADLLIDRNTPNIVHRVTSIQLEEDIFPADLMDELDKLFS